ncbi:hypothetical protein GGX14DRAFT_602210 [Mycena pura]|uniref:ATPase dynein-related AAA domain-containing protein n=1 Tax=Mycena pura TaxID=153505 RepID=A0AAD6YJW4_9AGAR|nr:hypothetical protein GGX14DRAFT_602210 [Mycena pura]
MIYTAPNTLTLTAGHFSSHGSKRTIQLTDTFGVLALVASNPFKDDRGAHSGIRGSPLWNVNSNADLPVRAASDAIYRALALLVYWLAEDKALEMCSNLCTRVRTHILSRRFVLSVFHLIFRLWGTNTCTNASTNDEDDKKRTKLRQKRWTRYGRIDPTYLDRLDARTRPDFKTAVLTLLFLDQNWMNVVEDVEEQMQTVSGRSSGQSTPRTFVAALPYSCPGHGASSRRAGAERVGPQRAPAKFDVEKDMNGRALAAVRTAPPATLLLSRIATAVSLGEPVLLTGETGTGKTSVVTHHRISGPRRFKPIYARISGAGVQERFLDWGTFSRRKNEKFEAEVRKNVAEGEDDSVNADTPRKKRKVDDGLNVSEASWAAFERDVTEFEVQHVQAKGKFAFGFVEGPLVRALRSGDWVLLDEINLASPETLECISTLLHSPTSSITLTEQGSMEPVPSRA